MSVGVDCASELRLPTGLLYRLEIIDRVKSKDSRETCPSATLPSRNPTWTEPGANLDLREILTTNRLSHGTSDYKYCKYIFSQEPVGIQTERF
jgi:hypothetical protein